MYSSTCFERPHAHHQELNNCSSSLWVYRWSVVVAVLLVVVGPVKKLFVKLLTYQNVTTHLRDFTPPSRCKGDLRSSGILGSVDW